VFRYFGPPGTGKTTTLLNQVDGLLANGTSPTEIGYFAFTRKAAHEAKDRAVSRFGLDPEKDFLYFRTLHSLAFLLLGMNNAEILTEDKLKKFGKAVGVDLSTNNETLQDEGFSILRSNHPIMRCIDLARNTLQGPEYAYNFCDLHMPYYEYEHVYKEYNRFKTVNGLKDFTDMMVELAANASLVPHLKVVFLDEAQDLTPLQWQVAKILSDNSDRMFVAGDDDQGIYRWAGADIDQFINLSSGSEVLEQSYRIPRSVHSLADRVSKRITHRQKKVWNPRKEEGSVSRIYDPQNFDFNGEGSWLVMAQANYMLDGIAAEMKSTGQFFERYNQPSLGQRVRDAISAWNHIQQEAGHEISLRDAQNLYRHISSGEGKLQRGAKKMLDGANDQDTFSLSVLRKHFGLQVPDTTWDVALDRIRDEDRAYITALLNRGVNIFQKPTIKLSTIHGSKGGEADNVLLYLDLSSKALQEMERNPDDAHRVLYVGITRTKNNLVLKMPEDQQRGWAV
tara:strand:- start:2036 stop:3559 length:1524 start_codon:yes stop_codon:yes gene_type:complete